MSWTRPTAIDGVLKNPRLQDYLSAAMRISKHPRRYTYALRVLDSYLHRIGSVETLFDFVFVFAVWRVKPEFTEKRFPFSVFISTRNKTCWLTAVRWYLILLVPKLRRARAKAISCCEISRLIVLLAYLVLTRCSTYLPTYLPAYLFPVSYTCRYNVRIRNVQGADLIRYTF